MHDRENLARAIEDWAFSLRSCLPSLGGSAKTDVVAKRVWIFIHYVGSLADLEPDTSERIQALLEDAIAAFDHTGDRITTARLLQQSARELRRSNSQSSLRSGRALPRQSSPFPRELQVSR